MKYTTIEIEDVRKKGDIYWDTNYLVVSLPEGDITIYSDGPQIELSKISSWSEGNRVGMDNHFRKAPN